VYYDHVVVTNGQGRLSCERLTINLPPEGAADNHPTNAVAETNVDIIFVNNKGETNHTTCDKGIYDYHVVNAVTNETFFFTGHATNTMAQGWFTGEPLIWDNIKQTFDFGSDVDMHLKLRGTNSSFNLPK
jgi:lipopolysaccharide export system protein LptA